MHLAHKKLGSAKARYWFKSMHPLVTQERQPDLRDLGCNLGTTTFRETQWYPKVLLTAQNLRRILFSQDNQAQY